MAKRYHQSGKDRMDERRGEERRDFGMISEDRSAVANLPQQVMYKAWPKSGEYMNYGVEDTIKGIDKQVREDKSEAKRHLQPEKY